MVHLCLQPRRDGGSGRSETRHRRRDSRVHLWRNRGIGNVEGGSSWSAAVAASIHFFFRSCAVDPTFWPCYDAAGPMPELIARLQTTLGDGYRITSELGGGGMSRVFVAEDVELSRNVVVKVLPPDLAAGLNVDRFRREIQMAARLQHPHIVPLLSAGARDGLLYFTMPFIAGESLRTRITKQHELPIHDAVRTLRDVVDALAYAHANGVVHRDIKPDNILMSGHHSVVTDFGVSKALSNSTGSSTLTSMGVALGTPAYMSPEQAAADPSVD